MTTTPYKVHLLDWSHYQKALTFKPKELEAAGCKGLVHKATEGSTWKDDTYTKRRTEAASAKFPFGAYHFATPSSSVDAQAKHFLAVAKPKAGDIVPMLDFEHGDFSKWTTAKRTDWVLAWLKVVEKAVGAKPFIYTQYDLDSRVAGYPLWTARYSNLNQPPRIPTPWKAYTVHQFSNGQYGVPSSFLGYKTDLNTLADPASFSKYIIGATNTTPPKEPTVNTWSQKTTYQGKTVNLGLKYILAAANQMVRHPYFGKETSDITLVQGCFHKGVSASAGTHDGSDALDTTAYNWKQREKVFRLLGVAYWHRPALPGEWNEHCHGITDGVAPDPKLVKGPSPSAGRQVDAYHARKNGLANGGPDLGYKMLVFPLFVFPEKPEGKPGAMWAKKDLKSYEQPTTKAKVRNTHVKGTKFTVVAVVRVGKALWAVTRAGRCVPMASLSRTEVKKDSTTPTTPPTTPPTKKTVKRKVAHASLQFSDTAAQHTQDVETLFSRGYHIITGTEAGPGANNTSAELRRLAKEKGYRLRIKGDTWVAVDQDIIKPGSWKSGGLFALNRSSKTTPKPPGRWGDKYVTWGQYFDKDLGDLLSVGSVHYLTNGGAGPKYKTESDKAYAQKEKEWSETTAKDGYALINGDFNRNDAKFDVFMGIAPFVTAADELKKHPNTGHGPIDAIARRKTDKGVKFTAWRVFTDQQVFLNSDHFLTEAVVEFTV